MKKACALALVTILIAGFLALPASANSAQTHWRGTDATGLITSDGDCPVVVEKEILTLSLGEFPDTYYHSLEDYLAYTGKVTAEYHFYNPSDLSVTATLLFPFGQAPTYAEVYDEETDRYVHNADAEKYTVTVNGEPIETKVRYTLSERYSQFSLEKDLPLLCDGYRKDSFYSPDLPVTAYTFRVSDVDEETYRAANAAFDLPKEGLVGAKIYFPDQGGRHIQKNGDHRVSTWADNGDEFTVYFLGQAPDKFPQWTFYENGGVEDREEIAGKITLTSQVTTTFGQLAMSAWSPESGVGETDWYNAVLQSFLDGEQSNGVGIVERFTGHGLDVSSRLMRWYEYEITLAPGERIVNAVTAPIYPDINASYDPAVYRYTYLLSPAKTWISFGELEILVDTPFYMTESGSEGFEKTESGYALSLPTLPEGELTFTLSTSENPVRPVRTLINMIPLEIIISFSVILLCMALLGGGIALAMIVLRKSRRGKKV